MPVLLLAFLLTACGGGGGGGSSPPATSTGSSSPATPVTESALRFTPTTVSASWEAGTSTALNVSADVNRPADFDGNVYAYVVDQAGVILPQVAITARTLQQYAIVLQTSPNLPAGQYKGNFTVNLCRDSACAQHYRGSPMQLPYDFQVAPPKKLFSAISTAPLSTTAYVGATTAPVAVTVMAEGRTWTAASDAAWVKLDQSAGSGNGSVAVRFDSTGLNPGSYTGALNLKASDGQTLTLALSLQVLAAAFHIDESQISFNVVNGAPIDPHAISITYEGGITGAWNAASDVTWLDVNPLSGSAPGTATLSVAARSGLASGIHTGKLTLSSPLNASRSIPVQLTLVPATFTVSSSSVTLGGSLGREFVPQTLSLGLNTLGNAWPWKLDTLPAWATVNAASGALSQSGAQLTLTPKTDSAPVGTSSAVLNASVTVNGDILSKPVALTINKDQHKILASETGVALVSTPEWSRLSRTLSISDNFGSNTAWSASSNQSWLTVATSGSQLVLTADPASLPQDAISYATVTLNTTAAGVTAPEPIRVALWKGAAAPSTIRKLAVQYQKIIADPIRPFVYAHAGATTIDVYNVYTGAKVATTPALGAALGDMAVGPNGDSLYVTDTANRTLVKLSLGTLTKAAAFPLASAVDGYTHLLAIRPNGVEVVLLSNGMAVAASDGRALGASGPRGVLAAPADGKAVYALNQGISPASLSGYKSDYSEMGGGTLFVASAQAAAWNTAGSNGTDLAVSPDGKRVYGASGSPYRCSAYQGSDLSLIGSLPGGDAYPNNVEVGSDGRVYCGIMGYYSVADVWVHAADGTLLKSFKFVGYAQGLQPRQMVVSGDGMMLVALTSDPLMAIVPVGP